MTPSGFGRRAMNDEKFVFRLRQGGNVTAKSLDRARDFIRDQDEGMRV